MEMQKSDEFQEQIKNDYISFKKEKNIDFKVYSENDILTALTQGRIFIFGAKHTLFWSLFPFFCFFIIMPIISALTYGAYYLFIVSFSFFLLLLLFYLSQPRFLVVNLQGFYYKKSYFTSEKFLKWEVVSGIDGLKRNFTIFFIPIMTNMEIKCRTIEGKKIEFGSLGLSLKQFDKKNRHDLFYMLFQICFKSKKNYPS